MLDFLCLTPEQIKELTGYQVRSCQKEALNSMGIDFKVRPNGTLAVLRSHVEKVMGGMPENLKERAWEPDWEAVRCRANG